MSPTAAIRTCLAELNDSQQRLPDAELLGYYRTNSRGYRGDEFPPPADGGFRVIAIGDSCTFGLGVFEEATWPSRLQRALERGFAGAIACDVVVAGPANPARLAAFAAAGADAAVVTPATLRAFIQHPLTDRGIDRFLGDVSRRARPRRTK